MFNPTRAWVVRFVEYIDDVFAAADYSCQQNVGLEVKLFYGNARVAEIRRNDKLKRLDLAVHEAVERFDPAAHGVLQRAGVS